MHLAVAALQLAAERESSDAYVDSLVEQLSLNGRAFTSSYSAAAHTVTQTTPAGRQTVSTLDSQGRLIQSQVPGMLPVQIQYDARGKPSSVTQGSRVYRYAYDSRGNLASLTDPLGRSISFGYDLAGRPTLQVLPDGRAVSLAYDASGNVTSVTPPGRPAHSFGYTPVDLEQSYSPPTLGFPSAMLTSYNPRQAGLADFAPRGRHRGPDLWQRRKARERDQFLGHHQLQLQPDDWAARADHGAGSGDAELRLRRALLTDTSWSGAIAGAVHRTYDNFFRVASESVSGGPAVSYQYDADGLLTSAGALQIQRDPATGFATGSALGGTTESRTYDAYGAEASYKASFGGSNLYSVTYARDALGRITSKTERVGGEAAHTFSYSYDLAGRLTDTLKDGTPTAHYAFDANGNRLAGPGLNSTPAYDAQDRLLSYGACSYTYKASGELQTKTCADGTTTYDYDALGNLRHVGQPNGTQIDYLIDGQNRRIGKTVNGALVEGFLYRSQLKPAAWLNGDNSVRATFVYGLHRNVPEYMVKGGTTYRLFMDQVGSVRLVVDSAGNIAERIDYDEFGNVLADSAPGFQPFGFAGGLRDIDSGLTRFGARDYDPITGRWTAKDSTRFRGGLNLYSYTGSDPINFFDVTGDMRLPATPSGLPPDWKVDPTHLDPNGTRLRHPGGDYLDFHKGAAWRTPLEGTGSLASQWRQQTPEAGR